MRTYKIYLIRHGLTDANKLGKFVGSTDVPLCEEGIMEIIGLKDTYEYPNVGRVYSSPLLRAVQTARLIYPEITPITVKGLGEYNFGEFENHTIEELKEQPRFMEWMKSGRSITPQGGETLTDFQKRIVDGLNDVILDMMKDKLSDAALVVHGGVIMNLLSLCGLPKRPITEWTVQNGKGFTLMINASLWGNTRSFEVFTPLPYGIDKEAIMMDYQRQYAGNDGVFGDISDTDETKEQE